MNKKNILTLLLVGLIVLIIYHLDKSMCRVEKFNTLHYIQPLGSYRDMCSEIFYDGYQLIALCPDIKNVYKRSQIKCDCLTNRYGVNSKGELICEN